jgi:uncharacterized membrane protein YedE/YeeE
LLPAIIGTIVGARLCSRFAQGQLRRLFAGLVFVAAFAMASHQLGMPLQYLADSPYAPLAGGALVGLAAVWMWLLHGRIAGISGIAGGVFNHLFDKHHPDRGWRLSFLAGLVVTGFVVSRFVPHAISAATISIPDAAAAGLMVGIGTTLSNGCTSGHGVCGISRLSKRSVVATLTFIAAGMVTVLLTRHVFAG